MQQIFKGKLTLQKTNFELASKWFGTAKTKILSIIVDRIFVLYYSFFIIQYSSFIKTNFRNE